MRRGRHFSKGWTTAELSWADFYAVAFALSRSDRRKGNLKGVRVIRRKLDIQVHVIAL